MKAWFEIAQPFFGSVALAEQGGQYSLQGGLNFTPPQIINGYFGYNLIPGNKAEFITKLLSVCKALGISNPNWLLVTMYKESTLQPNAVNDAGTHPTHAVGLIQWMPNTLKQWGLTWQQVKQWSGVKQLDLVYKYFQPYKKWLKDLPSIYLSVFFPLALSKPANYIFAVPGGASAQTVRNANKGIDINKDGVISKDDFYTYVYKGLPKLALSLVAPKNVQSEVDYAGNTLPGVEVIAKPTYYTFSILATITAGLIYSKIKG